MVFFLENPQTLNQSYVTNLALNVAKGGVATAWMFRSMKISKICPKALLLNFANPIIAQGAAHANLPLTDRHMTLQKQLKPVILLSYSQRRKG